MTQPDKDLSARLAHAAKYADQRGGGVDLRHMLSDAYRSGQLVTRAELDAAVLDEREACAAVLDFNAEDMEADAKRFRQGTDPHHYRTNIAQVIRTNSAAIRARGVTE